jgi:hypothetical protein
MTRFENVAVFILEKVWLENSPSQTFSRINTPTFSNLVILHTYPPVKMEKTECSEMLAYKIQIPWNCPEESKQQ